MEKNFTLPAFAEPITALPDTPNLSASELKRRFQAPSDELREVHNALAKTVQGITDATYPETVSESMLTADLAGKINGKAEQTALDAAETRISTLETDLPHKCEVYFGIYQGDGKESQTITLCFAPKWILIFNTEGCGGSQYNGGLAFQNQPCELGKNEPIITLNGDKLTVYNKAYGNTWARTNFAEPFCYLMGR